MSRTGTQCLTTLFFFLLVVAGSVVADTGVNIKDETREPSTTRGQLEVQVKGALERCYKKVPLELQATDGEITRLKKRRYNQALIGFQARAALWEMGGRNGELTVLQQAHERYLDAELALVSDPKARAQIYHEHLLVGKNMADTEEKRYLRGPGTKADWELAQWWTIEIELRMAATPQDNPNR
ncbi:MAG: hypothetical protein KJ000_12575 [Pirellulaceae bacterium]|nr:hypothetical protein [Pirellulaceae bacterium]